MRSVNQALGLDEDMAARAAIHQGIVRAYAHVRSAKDLKRLPQFLKDRKTFEQILETPEVFAAPHAAPSVNQGFVRVVAWNVERGFHFFRIVQILKEHPILSKADVYLLQETDFGMARSGNRYVARDLGRILNLHAAFGPEYLHFEIGNGAERSRVQGQNTAALEGNAILSRFPLRDVRLVSLPHPKDQVAAKEKRIGAQTALWATIDTPLGALDATTIHLSAHSSRGLRRRQLRKIVESARDPNRPLVLGGDWNTTTYHANQAVLQILGFWRRVLMGVRHVMMTHYPYPEHYFERRLFRMLEKHGFDFKTCNVLGTCTMHQNFDDPAVRDALRDITPDWCFRFVHWALRDFEGRVSMKTDWFTTRGVRAQNPHVVYDLPHGSDRISDHDPISIDVKF